MNRIFLRRFVLAALFVASIGPMPAPAATFCVASSAEFTSALATAATNGADDVIRLRSGVYTNPAGVGDAFVAAGESHALTISGGWFPLLQVPCAAQVGTSVIDGEGARRALRVAVSVGFAPVTLRDLTFRNGETTGGGAGLQIQSLANFAGDVTLDHLVFQDNHAGFVGGALDAGTDGGVFVLRDSLFVGNGSGDGRGKAVSLTVNASSPSVVRVFVGNNTIVDSYCDTPPCNDGAMRFAGDARAAFYNNLFASNVGGDLRLAALHGEVYFNNYLSLIGTPQQDVANVAFVDPKFVDAAGGNYRLRPTSPLVDLGTNIFTLDDEDLAGIPRVLGLAPDVGAYEVDSLFLDGYENWSPAP